MSVESAEEILKMFGYIYLVFLSLFLCLTVPTMWLIRLPGTSNRRISQHQYNFRNYKSFSMETLDLSSDWHQPETRNPFADSDSEFSNSDSDIAVIDTVYVRHGDESHHAYGITSIHI
jgi:hypothetical protein